MFFGKKPPETRTYDKETLRPVIRASICTGERAAGFQDIRTGKITEVMLLRTPADLEEFQRLYQIADVEITVRY